MATPITYTPEALAHYVESYYWPHQHSWLGGEVDHVTEMPGEANYATRVWYCQFCGVQCAGETLDYAAKRPYVPDQLVEALDR